MEPNMICRECESVMHCMAHGCIPVTEREPGTWADTSDWLYYALIAGVVFVFALLIALPLYFGFVR